MSINGAQLDAQITYPVRAGEILSVAAPYPTGSFVPFPPIFPLPTNQPPPAAVNGTFNGLPDGAMTNFSGRPFRINYSLSAGQVVLPGVFLTALPLRATFTNIVRQANGIVVLQGRSEQSANVVFEGSTNLIQWTVLGNTSANAAGQFQFTDSLASGFRNRFYRASSQ
jgi:hypothetical protein